MNTMNLSIYPVIPYQALYMENGIERILVICDLHIGWEAALTQKGVHITSQMPRLLKKIKGIIKSRRINSILIVPYSALELSRDKLSRFIGVIIYPFVFHIYFHMPDIPNHSSAARHMRMPSRYVWQDFLPQWRGQLHFCSQPHQRL